MQYFSDPVVIPVCQGRKEFLVPNTKLCTNLRNLENNFAEDVISEMDCVKSTVETINDIIGELSELYTYSV